MKFNVCFDGYMVQGYVDKVGECISIEDWDGSWYFCFCYEFVFEYMLVDKGFVCVNGVSLIVVNFIEEEFSVVIILYIYEYINFN